MFSYAIIKRITGYSYPRNGNVHNPTPQVRWEVWQMDGETMVKCLDTCGKLKPLQKDWDGQGELPKAIRTKEFDK